VEEVLAVMATAGLYDDSGKWLFHTGLPAKEICESVCPVRSHILWG